jgi:opacity protein-like surface antigen
MKKLYLLLLCTIALNSGFSQEKHEFGLLIKGGNFTSPTIQIDRQWYEFNQAISTNSTSAGFSLGFGIWKSIRLGAHFRISAELMYRYSTFSKKLAYEWKNNTIGIVSSTSAQSQESSESSLSLPVKVHYAFRKNGPTSIHVGFGVSRVIMEQMLGSFNDRSAGYPQFDREYTFPVFSSEMKDFNPMMTAVFGVQHKIAPQTSIGLEFTYERNTDVRKEYPHYVGPANLIDCLCYGFTYLGTANRYNFSASIFHNLQR